MVEKDCASVSSSLAPLKEIERDDVEDVETLNESQAFVNVVILLHCPENFHLAAGLNEIISHRNTASVVKDATKSLMNTVLYNDENLDCELTKRDTTKSKHS